MRSSQLTAILLVSIAACDGPVREPVAVPDGADPLAPVELVDLDPDPSIVEVELAAGEGTHAYLPGKPASIWGYRDASTGAPVSVPGPLLRAPQGALVRVRFRNELPVATTIHWHGLRVPNGMDGVPGVQRPIEPGERFTYEFAVPDAGTYWYHPHVEGDVQIERGLYGPLVVDGGTTPDVAHDRYFQLDDVKVGASGALVETTDALDVMLGRQGNVLVANGVRGATLPVRPGTRERWRFGNAANGRFFHLRLAGHRFLVIGWDGGLLEAPYEVETLLVAPGERYEVLVELEGAPGSTLPLETIHHDRGHDLPDPGPQAVLTLAFGDRAEAPPAALPATWRTIEPLPVDATTPVRRFVLSEREEPGREPVFLIDERAFPEHEPVQATLGALEVWEVESTAEMDHPFHLHGAFFQLLDETGAPRRAWKDTVVVPKGAAVRFAVRHDAEGMWMFHCHILEHAERGMMGELHVSR